MCKTIDGKTLGELHIRQLVWFKEKPYEISRLEILTGYNSPSIRFKGTSLVPLIDEISTVDPTRTKPIFVKARDFQEGKEYKKLYINSLRFRIHMKELQWKIDGESGKWRECKDSFNDINLCGFVEVTSTIPVVIDGKTIEITRECADKILNILKDAK